MVGVRVTVPGATWVSAAQPALGEAATTPTVGVDDPPADPVVVVAGAGAGVDVVVELELDPPQAAAPRATATRAPAHQLPLPLVHESAHGTTLTGPVCVNVYSRVVAWSRQLLPGGAPRPSR